MKQWLFFGCGFFAGMVTLSLSFASVPKTGVMTDNTAIYQAPTEITVPKQQKLDFDNDIGRLSEMEGRYQEKNLSPLARNPRIAAPMKRVSQQKYVYSGNKRAAPVQHVQQSLCTEHSPARNRVGPQAFLQARDYHEIPLVADRRVRAEHRDLLGCGRRRGPRRPHLLRHQVVDQPA